MTESQKRCASCSLRSTDTQAARSRKPAASSHERSKIVFPLPAGAETSVTPPARSAAESVSNRASRATTGGATTSGCSPTWDAVLVASKPSSFERPAEMKSTSLLDWLSMLEHAAGEWARRSADPPSRSDCSADAEHSLHPGRGVPRHGAEVRVAALLREGHRQL